MRGLSRRVIPTPASVAEPSKQPLDSTVGLLIISKVKEYGKPPLHHRAMIIFAIEILLVYA